MIDLSKKSPAELKKLLDSVKVSDLPVAEKKQINRGYRISFDWSKIYR